MAVGWTESASQTPVPFNATTAALAMEHEATLRAVEVLAVVLMSAIIVVAFHGNLFIIIVIIITPQLRSSMANIFIVNLCIVDLLAAVLAIPLSVVTFVHGEVAFDKELCMFSGFLTTFVMVVSMLSVCVISAERFYSIALPMHHAGHATPCMYIIAVLFIWAMGITLSVLPCIGVNSYSFRQSNRTCTYYWQGGSSTDRTFVGLIFTLSFLIPSIIIITMYVGIFRVARKAATCVGPHPSTAALPLTNQEVGVRDSDRLVSHSQSPRGPIFTISSPETVSMAAPHIEEVVPCHVSDHPGTRPRNELTLSGRENSDIRAADVTDDLYRRTDYLNNKVKVAEGSGGHSMKRGQHHARMTCSRFLCACKKAGSHCISGPSITASSKSDEPASNRIPEFLPKPAASSCDAVKVKASHMKAFKTLMIIVVSYFVLWSPYFLCHVYGLTHGNVVPNTIEVVVTWLSLASYAVNPCLYGLKNRLIRDELSQLLECLCCACAHGDRRCRPPCQKVSEDDQDDNGDDCLGGAESFYQFLQRTHASDATIPVAKTSRRDTPTHTANVCSTEHNSNNLSSDRESNCVF